MANSKIPLRRFRMDAKSPTLFYFLRIIGITLVDNKFVSTRTDVRVSPDILKAFALKSVDHCRSMRVDWLEILLLDWR